MKTRKRSGLFYGWVVIAAASIIIVTGYGQRWGFPVFYVYILQAFGWTRASTALAYSLMLLVYGCGAIAMGYLGDRLGPRWIIAFGAVVLALGLVGLNRTSQPWHLYLFYGLFVGLGTCSLGNPSIIPIISNWFVRRRGAALGMYFAGASAATIMGSFSEYIISRVGWRNAYLVLAVIVLAIIIPVAVLIIRTRPQDKGLLPDGDTPAGGASLQSGKAGSPDEALIMNQEWAATDWTLSRAIRTPQFWALFLIQFGNGIQVNMLNLHQVAHMFDVGFSQVFAASILGLVGFAHIPANLCGFVSDRIGRERAFTVAMLTAMVGIYIFSSLGGVNDLWMAYAYAIFFGAGFGFAVPAVFAAHADMYGGKHFGAINGLLITGFGIGGFIGSYLAGWVFDVFRSYTSAFMLAVVMGLVCIVAMWLAAPRKIRLVPGLAKVKA